MTITVLRARPRPVEDAARDRDALVRAEDERVGALHVDLELALEDEEELVLGLVLVPVELSFDDSETDDGVVDLRERLVEPRLDGGRLGADVDPLELFELHVEIDLVRLLCHSHLLRSRTLRRSTAFRAAVRRRLGRPGSTPRSRG